MKLINCSVVIMKPKYKIACHPKNNIAGYSYFCGRSFGKYTIQLTKFIRYEIPHHTRSHDVTAVFDCHFRRNERHTNESDLLMKLGHNKRVQER